MLLEQESLLAVIWDGITDTWIVVLVDVKLPLALEKIGNIKLPEMVT